ncbi:hypothetical protein E1193_13840 [Micromonospora sp. KC606]|uniref:hypothetical protein n=1 Tax=Micromonospora sp. KC606 TaxID=2530379 RepID=UPI0010494696|nr:hypothetical protein [Micromonospora sp. KC606]TDC81783.1 hypothetical protein E1193_13840 [Micromonospora sp. KC606]
MSQPQPPNGPQDPNQPPVDPFPTAPVPQYPADPTAPLPPVSGVPQSPYAPVDPTTPQPPVSGTPYPPMSGSPYPPVSGTPYPPMSGSPYPPVPGSPYPAYDPNASMPPVSGTPYPPVSGGGYPPPPGGPYPPAPGQPLGPPVRSGSKKTVWIVVGVVVAVLLLLCCGGGVAALVAAGNEVEKKAGEFERSLPTPDTTTLPGLPGGKPSASAPADGETFNMKPGDTLVLEDDDGTIEIAVRKFSTFTKPCRSYARPPEKGMFLVADVTATVTRGRASINPFYFKWVAEDGTTSNGFSAAFSGCGGDMLGSGSGLPSGSKRTGVVVFDVKDKNGVVEYQHRFETAGSWRP